MAQFSIPISDIVDLLGLERSPHNNPGSRSIKVHCPFCDHKGYTMDVDLVSNVYHCFHCPEDMQKNTGALDLYSRVRMGGPSRNFDRKKVFRSLCEELGGKAPHGIVPRREIIVRDTNIYPASDEKLNQVYSALLKLPYLRLHKKHADNLIGRGLPERLVYSRKRKFATLPPSYMIVKDHPGGKSTADWYWSKNIDDIRKNSPVLRNYSWKDIAAGVIIATDLIHQGLDLRGVPGFFHITPKKWAFRYDPGMLVPTISFEGNIVGFQTRRDTLNKSGLRYMTLSSKGLPDGVTANIARTHVVHNREAITSHTNVLITEGPLKADIALWYLTRDRASDVAVIALQGVKNTREVPKIAKLLKEAGVTKVYSAFDMDKCGNVAVADAGVALRRMFTEAGLQVETMVWDRPYAETKLAELMQIAEQHQIPFTPSGNPFTDIAKLAKIFTANKIEYNIRIVDGKRVKDPWRSSTKGIDDYLKTLYDNSTKGKMRTSSANQTQRKAI